MSADPVTRRAFLAFRLAGAPDREPREETAPETPDDPFASYDIACARGPPVRNQHGEPNRHRDL